jgi:hypothetical protein
MVEEKVGYLPVCFSLQRGRDEEFLRGSVILNPQYIRLATDLAVFDIALPAPRRLVHRGGVPLSATRALVASFHEAIISHVGARNLSAKRSPIRVYSRFPLR